MHPYDFNRGRCLIWYEGACNGAHTMQFPEEVASWLGDSDLPTTIIWDGVPWHGNKLVQQKATEFKFTLRPLPGNSPDLNPIEGLWKWMRENVAQHHCYKTTREFLDACKAFIDRINKDTDGVVKRLWQKFEMSPGVRKTPGLIGIPV